MNNLNAKRALRMKEEIPRLHGPVPLGPGGGSGGAVVSGDIPTPGDTAPQATSNAGAGGAATTYRRNDTTIGVKLVGGEDAGTAKAHGTLEFCSAAAGLQVRFDTADGLTTTANGLAVDFTLLPLGPDFSMAGGSLVHVQNAAGALVAGGGGLVVQCDITRGIAIDSGTPPGSLYALIDGTTIQFNGSGQMYVDESSLDPTLMFGLGMALEWEAGTGFLSVVYDDVTIGVNGSNQLYVKSMPAHDLGGATHNADAIADVADLITATRGQSMWGSDGDGTMKELAAGTNDYLLTPDSTADQGVKWAKGGRVVWRGTDLAAAEYAEGDLTIDSAWHDIDLSAKAEAGVSGYYLNCHIKDATIGKGMYFRKNGNAQAVYGGASVQGIWTHIANTIEMYMVWVECDSSGVIEYLVNTGTDEARFSVLGYTVGGV